MWSAQISLPDSHPRIISWLALACSFILIFSFLAQAISPVTAQDGDNPVPTPTLGPPPPLVELNETTIKQATVYILQVLDTRNGPIITCVGSGTLVSSTGLILTNAHIALPSGNCQSDRVVIALTLRLDEPPIPTYVADVVDSSPGLDLAILQISSYIDGRVVETSTLQLPFVELGDSDAVQLDDTIFVAGYPDAGNTPVQTIQGTISGFTGEARVGDRAWLRTDASIPGGISGGGAYDREGKLIGVPTIAPARIGGAALECRSVQDSNGDGQVDDEDICVPIGGFISALRPSRLARGLVRGAALGIRVGEDFAPAVFAPPVDNPDFLRAFTSTGVNAAGMPINVVTSLPAGATSLYLFFDYRNMVNGYVYELRTTVNGRPNPTFSLPPVTWNGGPRGIWYIGSSGVPLPNGVFEFTLFIEGRQSASYQLTVGGAAAQLPEFSDISFGLQDSLGNVVGTNFVLPETNIVRARFNYRNMRPELPWTQVWYLDDQELARTPLTWTGLDQGVSQEAAIISESGLLSGRYRLELYIEDRLTATADFVIAGGAEATQAQIFSNFRFATSQVAGVPQPPIGETFSTGVNSLYVFFDWRQLSQRTPWTWRWKVDNDTLFQSSTTWAAPPTGSNYYLALEGLPTLPDGTYTFEIEMGGIIIETVNARVGLGQLPVELFASAEGIQLTGRILDAQTGAGIPGAAFILLFPEFSVEDFTWDASQVLAMSLADSQGFFQLPALLPRGTRESPVLYSMLVRADGYLPMQVDGISVTDDTESPLEITVELNRD